MAKTNNLHDFLLDLANAIRSKKGSSESINPQNFSSEISSISTEKPEQTKTVELNMASGNQSVSPDSGYVLTQVTVTKPSTLTAGNIKKDVNIGGVTGDYEPALQEKTAVWNGDVTPDSDKYGLSKVTVAVPIYDGTEGTVYSISGNVFNGYLSGDLCILPNGTATVYIDPATGFGVPDNVYVTGATAVYSKAGNSIELSEPTGNVTITCECVEAEYDYTLSSGTLRLTNAPYRQTGGTVRIM